MRPGPCSSGAAPLAGFGFRVVGPRASERQSEEAAQSSTSVDQIGYALCHNREEMTAKNAARDWKRICPPTNPRQEREMKLNSERNQDREITNSRAVRNVRSRRECVMGDRGVGRRSQHRPASSSAPALHTLALYSSATRLSN